MYWNYWTTWAVEEGQFRPLAWAVAKRVLSDVRRLGRSRSGPWARGATIASDELELELAELGLSGRRFGPLEYAEALGERLGIRVLFRFVDPLDDPCLMRRFASDGVLADVRYLRRSDVVLISLPISLSPFLLTLAAFHELAHVTAGDLIEEKRLPRRAPPEDRDEREEAADVRARYLYLAGSLGAENPYALRLHGVP